MRISSRMLAGAFLALVIALSGAAGAQDYPNRPVTLIVPWPAGGLNDVVLRVIAEQAAKHLGQPIVIDNRAGGGGSVGPATMAATAKPDGYTISSLNTPGFLTMQVDRNLRFDPAAICPLARIVEDPGTFIVQAG